MPRAPFQVLVLPYLRSPAGLLYALLRRRDGNYWQWIAGGGEAGETPEQAARREAVEEAGIAPDRPLMALSAMAMLPVVQVTGRLTWGDDVLLIPEHAFAVPLEQAELKLSPEHAAYAWLDYAAAQRRLKWDSNKVALWELQYRLTHAG